MERRYHLWDSRRIATRHDKLAQSYFSALCLVEAAGVVNRLPPNCGKGSLQLAAPGSSPPALL